ncbi:uncharacterized protein EDB91DRAFT_1236594 [Suillus paluster]|uniref:uncharacterized protein n=1 Tax=Suillus paluster TaxID=48578 RepID=UPI001B85B4D3|nr:uncharacterized protein EDB91DRAFT_1236594 [Suillus paluster]KAG1744035.1 hypothetical protein EDB91DRAFT_1236594 [Suillus paluster]
MPRPLDADEEVLLEDIYTNIKQEDLHTSIAFITALQNASLNDTSTGLSKEAIHRLRDPPTHQLSLDDDNALHYIKARAAHIEYDGVKLPSLHQIKRIVAELGGVEEMVHDMCINTCVGFTGPFSLLDHCPECDEPHYDQDVILRTHSRFVSVPIGPQLQALYCDPQSAQEMCYRNKCTQEIIEELECEDGHKQSRSDFIDGTDYLEAVAAGKIADKDIVLMMSIDASDCWMSIWVVFDRSPETSVIIPGPRKPKNLDSFLFPGFHHLAALQNEGLTVWDAMHDTIFISHPFLALGTANGPGLAYLNGLIGHHGKNDYWLYYAGCPHYYPAHTRPPGYNVEGCNHPDVDVKNLPTCSSDICWKNLIYKRCLEMGISKQSIFLGFLSAHTFNIMHLISLNIPDLLIPLWHGTFEFLTGNVWKDFGKAVAATTPHLLGFFDCPPRNPAEKINSGYKAREFAILLYGIGPLVLHNLIHAVRIISQYNITHKQLQVSEFEQLYYHIHTLGHYGPLICASQWTMEHTIGNLVGEIHQPLNPYANLTQCAICRAQHNALMVMILTLDPDYGKPLYPRWSKDLGNGYALLKLQEHSCHATTMAEGITIKVFLDAHYPYSPEYSFFDLYQCFRVCCWACLRLPNGQTCRSLSIAGVLYFAEALFFFEIRTHPDAQVLEPLTLISIYSHPDRALLQELSDTFYTCKNRGEAGLRVVRVSSIQSVVAMIPHTLAGEERFYMFKKPGMDLANLGEILWDEDDEDNQAT